MRTAQPEVQLAVRVMMLLSACTRLAVSVTERQLYLDIDGHSLTTTIAEQRAG